MVHGTELLGQPAPLDPAVGHRALPSPRLICRGVFSTVPARTAAWPATPACPPTTQSIRRSGRDEVMLYLILMYVRTEEKRERRKLVARLVQHQDRVRATHQSNPHISLQALPRPQYSTVPGKHTSLAVPPGWRNTMLLADDESFSSKAHNNLIKRGSSVAHKRLPGDLLLLRCNNLHFLTSAPPMNRTDLSAVPSRSSCP